MSYNSDIYRRVDGKISFKLNNVIDKIKFEEKAIGITNDFIKKSGLADNKYAKVSLLIETGQADRIYSPRTGNIEKTSVADEIITYFKDHIKQTGIGDLVKDTYTVGINRGVGQERENRCRRCGCCFWR